MSLFVATVIRGLMRPWDAWQSSPQGLSRRH